MYAVSFLEFLSIWRPLFSASFSRDFHQGILDLVIAGGHHPVLDFKEYPGISF